MSIDKTKQKLQNATLDKEWIEKAEWRKANQDWLDISFSIAVKIGEILAENKKKNKFPKNQAELAEAMHCSPQYVSKLMKGEENLQIETIVRLSKILGVTLIQVPVAA
jgi:ribosome-binding protein aMBF1 (putative translation factor)